MEQSSSSAIAATVTAAIALAIVGVAAGTALPVAGVPAATALPSARVAATSVARITASPSSWMLAMFLLAMLSLHRWLRIGPVLSGVRRHGADGLASGPGRTWPRIPLRQTTPTRRKAGRG